jgi:hypothetical protein
VPRALNSLLAIGASATLIAGCGGSDGGDAPLVKPQVLLAAAAAHPVRSADVRGQARLTLNGSSVLAQPVTMRVEGPYVSGGGVRIPSFDWKFGVKVLGFGVGGKLVSTGQNVFLSPFGDNYEFGEPAIAAVNRQLAGSSLPARELLGAARNEGNAEVDGTDTQQISARLDGRAVAAAFAPWLDQLGLSNVPAPLGRIGVWIGLEDRMVHKLTLDADFEIAPADRPRFGGASGGNLRVEAELDEINEPQTIQVPGGGGYKPVGDLLLTLQDLGAFAP